jgi:hypothetical protein
MPLSYSNLPSELADDVLGGILASGPYALARRDLTITELIKQYRDHALKHYQKNGKSMSTPIRIWIAERTVRNLYGSHRTRGGLFVLVP